MIYRLQPDHGNPGSFHHQQDPKAPFPLFVHTAVFTKVWEILVEERLFRGMKIGADATTLEANGSMRALTHNNSGKSYREYAKSLKAKNHNEHWHNPHNRKAKITKIRDGSAHFAKKCEQAVNFQTGAALAMTVQGADLADTTTVDVTLAATSANLEAFEGRLREQQAGEVNHRGLLMRKLIGADTPRAWAERFARAYAAIMDLYFAHIQHLMAFLGRTLRDPLFLADDCPTPEESLQQPLSA